MEIPNQSPNFWQRNAIILKCFFVAILALLLLIPSLFVSNLVQERKYRQQEVKNEIYSKWASSQTITGPMIVIPYLETFVSEDKKVITEKKQLIILPEALKIKTSLPFEERHRSIYSAIVYNSSSSIDGSFNPINFKALKINEKDVLFNEAALFISVSDFKGIAQQVTITINDKQYELNAGSPLFSSDKTSPSSSLPDKIGEATLNTPIDYNSLVNNGSINFSYSLQLKGSESIHFIPVGKTTQVEVTSKWPHPDFQGSYLPQHSISNNGFTANWTVLHLNRSYPQTWVGTTYKLSDSDFGVNLIQPVDGYGKTQRTVKYAFMIIVLTFTLCFFLEIFQKRSMHALQYILVGIALCVFYTLLLSFSEYMNYNVAYSIAAFSTIIMLALFVKSIFHSFKIGLFFGGFLFLLYGYIFVLMQLEDSALLVGSIGLFIILSLIMYFSRKIEWNSYKQPS